MFYISFESVPNIIPGQPPASYQAIIWKDESHCCGKNHAEIVEVIELNSLAAVVRNAKETILPRMGLEIPNIGLKTIEKWIGRNVSKFACYKKGD